MAKVEATRNYGGRIELVGSHFEESLEAAIAHAEETGATFLHAFEDEHVIAGQGTIGLELHDQLDRVGEVVIPIGGGGLASGVALRCARCGRTSGSSASRRPNARRSPARPSTGSRSPRGSWSRSPGS